MNVPKMKPIWTETVSQEAWTSLSAQASNREAAAAVPENQTEEASRTAIEIRPRARPEYFGDTYFGDTLPPEETERCVPKVHVPNVCSVEAPILK